MRPGAAGRAAPASTAAPAIAAFSAFATAASAAARAISASLTFAASLALAAAGAAPARAAGPERLQSYRLGMDSGLTNNSVYCVYQDASGIMWFGTFGGLSKYDGETFNAFRPRTDGSSIVASVVFALAEDGDGYLWVGTDGGGLARYDQASNSFAVFRSDESDPGSLSSDRVLALAVDGEGRVWAGTGDGLLNVWDPAKRRFARIAPDFPKGPAAIRCILIDARGRVWAGSEGGGLVRIVESPVEDRGLTVFRHAAADPGSLAADKVRSLLEDSRGRVWIGLGQGGVDLYEGGSFRHVRTAGGGAAPTDAVRALGEDSEGAIWVGYADSGLGVIDPERAVLTPPAPSAAAMVRTIFRDRKGLMWVGYKEGGVKVFNAGSGRFERFTSLPSGQPLRNLRGMAQDRKGRVLVGSDGGGLVAMEPGSGRLTRVAEMPDGFFHRKVISVLAARDGRVWAGTDGAGLAALGGPGGTRTYAHDDRDPGSLASDVVWALFEDRDGSIYVGTEGGGLDRLPPGSASFEHAKPDRSDPGSLRGLSVRSILRDSKGRLWVGTWDGGLSRLDPGARAFRTFGPDSADPGSLGDSSVNCIFEDSVGKVWIGTGGSGLARFEEGSERFVHFREGEGLAGDTVYGIVEDGSGAMWISTSSGLSRFDRATGGFYNYGSEDGLASTELSQNSWLLDRDGKLWFGGPSGLTRFDPRAAPRPTSPPQVMISSIELPGADEPNRGRSGRGPLELDFRNAGFNFHVAVLDYAAPDRNRYAMRIEGRQSNWIPLGTHNTGYIGPLPPGRYLLRVKGANGNGVWNDEGATLAISVKPPYWATWWFRIAVFGGAGAALAGIIAIRLASLRRRNELLVQFSRHIEAAREEERTGAAREVHDEIGQHLAALNLRAYWLQSHPEAPSGLRAERVGEMIQAVGDAMAAVKSVATRLRPIALDALPFHQAVAWYAKDFERRSGIAVSLSIAEGLPRVGGERATALFRVLQEALTNVMRHAGARSVDVSLREEDGQLALEVRDDGVGIPKSRVGAPDSFGIIGMQERCAALGGTIEVAGEEGRGSSVLARVPAGPPPGPAGPRAGGGRPC